MTRMRASQPGRKLGGSGTAPGGAGNRGNGRDAPPDRYQRRLSISGRQTSQFAATGKPLLPKDEPAPQPEPQPNVYRKNKKRDTVEFTPRKERERTMPFTRPAPRREAEPVGEPVMTPNDTVQPQPAPAPQATTGFTMQLGDEPHRKAPSRSCMN